jgi:competence protein ComEC
MRWFDRVVSPRLRSVPLLVRASAGLAAATLCAEAVVVPITASAFSQVTFAGLLLNFIAVPAMAAIQVAGLAAVALTTCSSTVAAGAGWLAHLGVEALVRSAGLVDAWPSCARRVPAPPAALVGLYYAALLGAVLHTRGRAARGVSAVTATVCLAAMVAGPTWRARWVDMGAAKRDRRFTVTFLDVGQGDGALMRFPSGRALLVDAGGSPGPGFDVGARVVAPALWAMGTFRLAGAVITHGHPDHAGGMATAFEAFRPGWVWDGIVVGGDQATAPLRDAARRLGVAWRPAYAGTSLEIDGVSVRVLHPSPPDWERRRVRDDDSIVIEARYGGVSFVLMGDAGERVEAALAPAVAPAALRVLKAGHHGSADATSAAWLARLQPDVVVVSAGRHNAFNHPSPVMLERCRLAGRPVLRLDHVGAVQAVTDGRRLAVSSWNGSRWEGRLEATRAP